VANGRLSLLLRAFHVARKLLQWSGFTILRNENAHVLVRSLLMEAVKSMSSRLVRNYVTCDVIGIGPTMIWTVSWIRPMLWPG